MKARLYSLIFLVFVCVSPMFVSCLKDGSNTSTSSNVPAYVDASSTGSLMLATSGYYFNISSLISDMQYGSYGLASFTVDWGSGGTDGYYTAQMSNWLSVPAQEIINVSSGASEPSSLESYNDTTSSIGSGSFGTSSILGYPLYGNGAFCQPTTSTVTSKAYQFSMVYYADSVQTTGYDNLYLRAQLTDQTASTIGNTNVFKFDNINVNWKDTTVSGYNYAIYRFNVYYPSGTKTVNGVKKLVYTKASGSPFMVYKYIGTD